MKKALIISGAVSLVLVIGLLGYSLADTRSELSSAKNDLNTKIDELVSLNTKLEQAGTDLKNTTEELSKTNDNLDETINNLSLTKNELNDTKDELDSTKYELDSTKTELSAATAEMNELNTQFTVIKNSFDSINTSLENAKKELESANTTIEQLNKDIDLYKETFGEVHGDINPPFMIRDSQPPAWDIDILDDGSIATFDYINTKYVVQEPPPGKRPVNLINNPEAKNPTNEQLMEFLKEDKTDYDRYASNYYECGNFAETVHNNAEAEGIRAAFVAVDFDKGPSHALNAFITVTTYNQKLIYIDCTGHFEQRRPPNMDTTLPYLKLGSRYWRDFLFDVSMWWRFFENENKVTNITIYW